MNKTLTIFMYKEMACAHCNVRTGFFINNPSTTNPPTVAVAVENVVITKDAKEFIKSNHNIVNGEFSFTNLLPELPQVKLVGLANIYVLSMENNSVPLGNKSDIDVLDMIEEIESYDAPTHLLDMININIGQLI